MVQEFTETSTCEEPDQQTKVAWWFHPKLIWHRSIWDYKAEKVRSQSLCPDQQPVCYFIWTCLDIESKSLQIK